VASGGQRIAAFRLPRTQTKRRFVVPTGIEQGIVYKLSYPTQNNLHLYLPSYTDLPGVA
jgi:hypothetical protein